MLNGQLPVLSTILDRYLVISLAKLVPNVYLYRWGWGGGEEPKWWAKTSALCQTHSSQIESIGIIFNSNYYTNQLNQLQTSLASCIVICSWMHMYAFLSRGDGVIKKPLKHYQRSEKTQK